MSESLVFPFVWVPKFVCFFILSTIFNITNLVVLMQLIINPDDQSNNLNIGHCNPGVGLN